MRRAVGALRRGSWMGVLALGLSACTVDVAERDPAEAGDDESWAAGGKGDGTLVQFTCDGTSRSMTHTLARRTVEALGSIPAGATEVEIRLISSGDNDLQLEAADGTKLVQWPDGLLSGKGKGTTSYGGLQITYSGYGGDGTGAGHELLQIAGTLGAAYTLKAYGYDGGEAEVRYTCKTTGGSPDDPFPSGDPLKATGSGKSGSWQAYERADYSCTSAGGESSISCAALFSLRRRPDQKLEVHLDSISGGSTISDFVKLKQLVSNLDLTLDAAGKAAGTRTASMSTMSYGVEYDERGIRLTFAGESGYLNRCDGKKYKLSCDASYTWVLSSPGQNGPWGTVATLPAPRTYASAVTGLDGRIYVIGGKAPLADPYSGGPSAEDLSRVDVYLPWTGRWEQARDLPIAVVQHAATVAPDGRIFVLGGWSPGMSGNSPDVYAYYPAGNAWTREASMPTGRSFLAAVTTGGKIYAIGGQKGSGTAYYATTEIYDLQSGTWSKGPDMPTARSSHSAAVGGDGRIYVLGGVRGALPTWPNEDQVATVEAYDPARDQWSTVASLPEARRGSAAVADAQGRIYALGGEHNYFPMGSADRYDPETDTWTELPDLPRQRRFHAATRGADGRIYLLAGHNRDGYVSLVDVFDPSIP